MKIKSFKGGYDDNFCYLIWDEISLHGAIVDPSVSPSLIFKFIAENNIKLLKILITHTHYDHISNLKDFLAFYPNLDIYAYKHTRHQFNDNFKGIIHKDKILIGDIDLMVLYTPGHYDDCICYWDSNEKVIFTGDTVFVGRSGRTVNNYSDISMLYNSIYDIILKLPKNTIIYPGHDYGGTPSISIEDNIAFSSFFSCNSEKEFIDVMEKFESNR